MEASTADSEPFCFNSRAKKDVRQQQLSNFWPCSLPDDKGQWRPTTVEHEYQARKYEVAFGDIAYARCLRCVKTPQEAKKAGGQAAWVEWTYLETRRQGRPVTKKALRQQWKDHISQRWVPVSLATMSALLAHKFNSHHNPELYAALLSTDRRPLHETGRGHGFWIKSGQDKMGQLLMQLRARLVG